MRKIVAFLFATTILAGGIFYFARPAAAHLPPPVPPDDVVIRVPPVTWAREDTINGVHCFQETTTGAYEYLGASTGLKIYALSSHWASCDLEDSSDRIYTMHVEGWTWMNDRVSFLFKPRSYTAYDIWPCSGDSGIPENCPYPANVWKWTWDFSATDEAFLAWGVTKTTVIIERLQEDGTWRLISVPMPPVISDHPIGSLGTGRTEGDAAYSAQIFNSGYEMFFEREGSDGNSSSVTYGFDLAPELDPDEEYYRLVIGLQITDPESECFNGVACWLSLSTPPNLLPGEVDGVGMVDRKLLPIDEAFSFEMLFSGTFVEWSDNSTFSILFEAAQDAVLNPVMLNEAYLLPFTGFPDINAQATYPLWNAYEMHTEGPLAWLLYGAFLPLITR